MAKTKKTTKHRVSTRRISPFRNVGTLEREITDFMNLHKTKVAEHAKRLNTYFEMSCFNYIVRFYDAKGFDIVVEQLQDGKYRYKCSTQGNQENFSNFKISKKIKNETFKFGIYHNLAVQSFHEASIYTTPDIAVIKYGAVKLDTNHYSANRKLYYVAPGDLISFFEAKQFVPFPELMFNFIGTVNELMHEIMTNTHQVPAPIHLAPGLLVSGMPNKHALKIKTSLERRYCVNIIYDVFSMTANPFSKKRISLLKAFRQPIAALPIKFNQKRLESDQIL